MVKKDFYEILGVKNTDSSETIKKNYKKLALKYHPDKVSEDKKKEYEEKFKEINEAYTILGDEEKRKRYDHTGSTNNNFSQRENFQGEDLSDFLQNLFRNNSYGEQFSEEDEQTGQDLQYELTIEFKEAIFGCENEIAIKKNIKCLACNGDGSKDKKFKKCIKCNGHGRIKVSQQTPFGLISQVIKCNVCHGEGNIPENKCSLCSGSGVSISKETSKIKIPAGIDNGQILRIRNGGNEIKNGENGDLFLTIQVKPHKVFKREEFDVYMDLPISFYQAALGAEVSIPTLSSEEIKIKIGAGTEHGSILRIKGRGVPHINNPQHRGDQFVKILIKIPKKLSKVQIKLLEELSKLDYGS